MFFPKAFFVLYFQQFALYTQLKGVIVEIVEIVNNSPDVKELYISGISRLSDASLRHMLIPRP